MRTRSHLSTLLLLLLVLADALATACSSQTSSTDQSITQGTDAGMCMRDHDALVNLLVQPKACSTAADCPSGSHCDLQQGRCDWQCAADSDCSSGNTCDCNGYCIAAGGMPPGQTPVGDTCVRDQTVLQALATTPRACAYDSDCPAGSGCNPGSLRCELACNPGVTPGSGTPASCPTDQECDCNGRCVSAPPPDTAQPQVSTGRVRFGTRHVQLALDQNGLAVPGQVDVNVVLDPSRVPQSAVPPAVSITVRSTDPVQVSCDPTGNSFASTCTFSPWTFAFQDGVWTATRPLRLRTTPGMALPADPMWTVHFVSALFPAIDPLLVSVAPAPVSQPLDGSYTGLITLATGPDRAHATGQVDEPRAQLPVQAYVRNGKLVIVDATRSVVDADAFLANPTAPYATTLIDGASLAGLGQGSFRVSLESVAFVHTPLQGKLTGTLRLGMPASSDVVASNVYTALVAPTWSYSLQRTGVLPTACVNDASCGTGSACEPTVKVCVAKPATMVTGTPQNSLVDVRRVAWTNQLVQFFSTLFGSVAFTDLAIAQGTAAGSSTYRPNWRTPMLGGQLIPRVPSELGKLACDDFMRVVAVESSNVYTFNKGFILTRTGGTPFPGAGDPVACTQTGTASTSICSDIYSAGFLQNPGCTTASNADWTAELKAHYAPRLVATVSATDQATCVITTMQIKPGASAAFKKVILCPIPEPVADAAVDEQTACFNEAPAARSWVLQTNRQMPQVLPRSGDLACEAIRTPRVAEFFTAADETGTTEPDRATLYHDCFKDVRRLPDATIDFASANTALAQLFARHRCFSPARFHLANFGRPQTWLLQQWVGIHTFLAHETEQLLSTADAIRQSADISDDERSAVQALPDVREVLDEDEASWLLVLSYLNPGASTQNPLPVTRDYRLRSRFSTADTQAVQAQIKPGDEQSKLLDTVALEGLTAHVRLARRYLEESVGAKNYGGCLAPAAKRKEALARLGRTLRLAIAVESMVWGGSGYASAYYMPCPLTVSGVTCANVDPSATCSPTKNVCVGPDNQPISSGDYMQPSQAWVKALHELQSARADLATAARQIEECTQQQFDPGLALFFGDVIGANSQAFASSSYLLNVWARPAVASLAQVLAQARADWLATQDERMHDQETQYQREERLDAIANQYGARILELCGLPQMTAREALAALDPTTGTMTADNCFIVPSCTTTSGCLRGEIGAAFFDLSTLKKDAAAASARLDERHEAYQRAKDRCVQRQHDFAEDEDLLAEHEHTIEGLNDQLHVLADQKNQALAHAEQIGRISNAMGALGPAAPGGDDSNEDTAPPAPGSPPPQTPPPTPDPYQVHPGILAGSMLEQMDAMTHQGQQPRDYALKIENLERDIASKEREFSLLLTKREHARWLEDCYYEADNILIGVKSAALEIDAQGDRLLATLVRIRDMATTVNRNVREAAVAVDREMTRQRPSVVHHHWIKETMVRYERELDWARLLTYFAAKAVEYEYQSSLPGVDDILLAENPDQLETTIRELEREEATRTINTRRPEDGSIVLSLRDDLLGLTDKSGDATGEKRLSRMARFRDQLMSPANAVYDAQNHYLGQGIRFNLGDEQVLSARCAERLWRVTATLQGDFQTSSAPTIPIFVRKRNTFYSHWCEGRGDSSHYQSASVRATGNLLRPETIDTTESAGAGFTTASVHAWLNVPRAQFYRDEYREGSSEELAGRGLFGDYMIVFPWQGFLDQGFPLGDAEDVLMRFDFVSVDNFATGSP